jgi:hypothetical protein
VIAALGCGRSAAPAKSDPTAKLSPAKTAGLCITKGTVGPAEGQVLRETRVDDPVVRGFAKGSTGDAAAIDFVYRGKTDTSVPLASGDVRAQLGLKLRAADGCNLVYVMWRFEPKPEVVVQVKSNPGKHTHEECGANGYTRVKPAKSAKVFPPVVGASHRMWAELDGDSLVAWIDDRIVWQGTLPDVKDLQGPAGFRTDNVKADLALLVAADPSAPAKLDCPGTKPDD